MPKTFLFALLIVLFPTLVPGGNSGCALAYQLQQADLPQDIAVKADRMTGPAAKVAMDWWAERLSTPGRPITWHWVEDQADCMICIRYGWEGMMTRKSVAGYTYLPDNKHYDGMAIVKLLNPWVVAHEIGHLLGCLHGGGVMRPEYEYDEVRMSIDDRALHFALLVRVKASQIAIRRDSLAQAQGPAPLEVSARGKTK
jgi:hypothetical protein